MVKLRIKYPHLFDDRKAQLMENTINNKQQAFYQKGEITMQHKKFILLPIFILALAIVACSSVPNINVGQRLEGSGNVIRETRQVSGINRVSLSGFGHVEITQVESESLTVSTDDNIMPLIKTDLRGNTLVLEFTNEGKRRNIDPSD